MTPHQRHNVMRLRSAAIALSSTNKLASEIQSDGHDQPGAGVSRRWSGSILHHRKSNSIQLRLPLLPERQQRRHLSWQLRAVRAMKGQDGDAGGQLLKGQQSIPVEFLCDGGSGERRHRAL